MKTKLIVSLCVAGILAAAAVAWAQQKPTTPGTDSRIDKLVEQNEQILKNQAEILKKLDNIETGIGQLRRRAS
jgi:hypothetical protein